MNDLINMEQNTEKLPVLFLRRDKCPKKDAPGQIQRLLGEGAWQRLSSAVRRRFGGDRTSGGCVSYQGTVVETRLNSLGWVLAQMLRLFGAPLPLDNGSAGEPAVVTVTELLNDNGGADGQFWTRIYGRGRKYPQIICSVKKYGGKTGIEEFVRGGLSMSLLLRADARTLTFSSDRYFLNLCGVKLPIPDVLTPGDLKVVHEDLGGGWFNFLLSLNHPLFGELLFQKCLFQDPPTPSKSDKSKGAAPWIM